jgi:hypothetical protein
LTFPLDHEHMVRGKPSSQESERESARAHTHTRDRDRDRDRRKHSTKIPRTATAMPVLYGMVAMNMVFLFAASISSSFL